MSCPDFQFDLRVEAGAAAGALANALIPEVLRQTGYAGAAAADLGASITAAVGEVCRDGQPCAITFRAGAGALEVTVSAGPQTARRIVRELPR